MLDQSILNTLNPDHLRYKSQFIESNSNSIYVFAHGLNNHNLIFKDLIDHIQGIGHSILNISLLGHRGDINEFKYLKSNELLEHFISHLNLVKNFKDIYFVGFSLGCLLHQMSLSKIDFKFKKSFYFSPGLFKRDGYGFVNHLKGTFIIPSLSPKNYRVYYGTSLNAYRAVTDLQSSLRKLEEGEYYLFQRKGDEIIDLIKNFEYLSPFLSSYNLLERQSFGRFNHLTIDKNTLNSEEFKLVLSVMG